jgi:hypothetical protein
MPLNQYPCNRKISRTRHHGIGVIMLEFNIELLSIKDLKLHIFFQLERIFML